MQQGKSLRMDRNGVDALVPLGAPPSREVGLDLVDGVPRSFPLRA